MKIPPGTTHTLEALAIVSAATAAVAIAPAIQSGDYTWQSLAMTAAGAILAVLLKGASSVVSGNQVTQPNPPAPLQPVIIHNNIPAAPASQSRFSVPQLPFPSAATPIKENTVPPAATPTQVQRSWGDTGIIPTIPPQS